MRRSGSRPYRDSMSSAGLATRADGVSPDLHSKEVVQVSEAHDLSCEISEQSVPELNQTDGVTCWSDEATPQNRGPTCRKTLGICVKISVALMLDERSLTSTQTPSADCEVVSSIGESPENGHKLVESTFSWTPEVIPYQPKVKKRNKARKVTYCIRVNDASIDSERIAGVTHLERESVAINTVRIKTRLDLRQRR